jgi:squalene monooxygenase
VGELLQPGGYLALERLGLAECVEGIDATEVHGYCMFKAGKEARVKYPLDQTGNSVAGRSFHNGRFVQRLRLKAASAPGVTIRKGTVRKLVNDSGEEWAKGQVVVGVEYKAADGEVVTASACLTVVCDGIYSGLRSRLMQPDIKHPSYFVGLLLKDVELPHPGFGHVVLADPSPVLFYPISSNEVRCLVDYPGTKLPSSTAGDLQKYLLETVAPQVPPSLRVAFEDAVSCGRVRSMQNRQLSAPPLRQVGALLLGDSFNMRHPLTGGGMTVALSDTSLLCDMLRQLPDLRDALGTSDATAAYYLRRKPISATINTLANALYRVFCSADAVTAAAGAAIDAPPKAGHEEMRQACFDYLCLGGACSAGPISLLSGLNPRPSVLIMHFFMVALYGVGRQLLPRPTLRGLWTGILLLYQACCIIFPIIKAEGVRAAFMPFLAGTPKVGGDLRRVASQVRLSNLKAL